MTKDTVEKYIEEFRGHGDLSYFLPNFYDKLRTTLTTAIEEARADAEHEAFESRQILWNRLKKWNNEWRAENPKERALTNEDALKLIEWKLEQVKEEARREALEEVRVRVSDSHVVQLPFCDDEFVHKTALLDYIDSLTK